MNTQAARSPANNVAVLHLRREMDVELSHLLLGKALKRIRKFADTYDTDADGMTLAREVERDFARDRDHEYMVVLAINEDLQVGGHLLARFIEYFGRRYIWIMQMEIDPGSGVTIEQEREVGRWVKLWGQEIGGIHGIRGAALTATHVRRLQMIHGGKSFLTWVKWEG